MPHMPNGRKTKKPNLEEEINNIKHAQHQILREIKKVTGDSKMSRAITQVFYGVFRGVGFVIGATIITTIILVFMQDILENSVLHAWITDSLSDIITDSAIRASGLSVPIGE